MTSLPAVQGDVWRVATQQEKTFWLGLLSTLRESSDADAETQALAYGIVLEDAPFYGMSEAIKLFLKGRTEFNPAFAPKPSELGAVIDRVMEPFVEARAREEEQRRRFERCEAERRAAEARRLVEASAEAARRAAAPPARPRLSPQERRVWPRYRDGGEAAVADIAAKFPGWWQELKPKLDVLLELEPAP